MAADDNTGYDESYAKTAKAMAKLGATDYEIRTELGISHGTFYRWRWTFPQFAAALMLGKKAADDRVEAALYARAVGYTFDSEKIVVMSGGKDMPSEVERVPIVEHVPPDVRAAEYWLNNRRPRSWQHKVTQQIEGNLKFETIQRDTKDLEA